MGGTDCGAGQYSDSSGASNCEDCGKTSQPNKQAQTSNTVGHGNYVTSGATHCTACEPGRDNSDNSGGVCDTCVEGKYSSSGSACTDCTGNKQTQDVDTVDQTYVSSGAKFCVNCKAGKDISDGGECDDCAGGKYSSSGSACTHCDTCTTGQR